MTKPTKTNEEIASEKISEILTTVAHHCGCENYRESIKEMCGEAKLEELLAVLSGVMLAFHAYRNYHNEDARIDVIDNMIEDLESDESFLAAIYPLEQS